MKDEEEEVVVEVEMRRREEEADEVEEGCVSEISRVSVELAVGVKEDYERRRKSGKIGRRRNEG
jgi:hypothetical protein